LDLVLLQKNDNVAINMLRLLEEWGAHEDIVQLLKNRDASQHRCRFAFEYAFQNECDKTFKYIVKQIFDYALCDFEKVRSMEIKEGLKRNGLEFYLTRIVEDFVGLWSVAIRALGALPKECA